MPINYPGDDDFVANVRIKDTTDAALGGLGQPANHGLEDLADRTTYLQARRLEDYRAQIEASSGGRATVLEDANGNWHVMARIPAFKSSVFDSEMTYPIIYPAGAYHPAFRLDATINIKEFLIACNPVSLNADDEPVTIPGTLPDLTMTLDQAIAAATALGYGWHVMTLHEYAAIAFYALARVTNLRGNNADNDPTAQEYGRQDVGMTTSILSGTGPLSWRHDAREFGVSELVGGFPRFVNLFKTVGAKIHFPFYNEFWKGVADWDDQLIYFDHSGADELNINGAVTLNSTTYVKAMSDIEYGSDFTPGALPASLVDPRLCEMLLHNTWYTDGTPPTAHTPVFLDGRIGDLSALIDATTAYYTRGGVYSDGDDAALPCLARRATSFTGAQWHLCYIDPSMIPA